MKFLAEFLETKRIEYWRGKVANAHKVSGDTGDPEGKEGLHRLGIEVAV